MNGMHDSIVIGIAGGSGSGKSTLLSSIVRGIGRRDIAFLDHDSYYRELDHLTIEERAKYNFDHPDALETDLLCEHVDSLRSGKAVQKPTYDFETYTRRPSTLTVEPRRVIVVEGILVLTNPDLVRRMDIKVFVDADPDVRLIRRIRRDIARRGRSLDAILEQYEETVRPMHMQFVDPSRRQADVIVPHGGENQVAVDMILARIRSRAERRDAIAL